MKGLEWERDSEDFKLRATTLSNKNKISDVKRIMDVRKYYMSTLLNSCKLISLSILNTKEAQHHSVIPSP